ncbi:hypothetical protein TNCV_1606661 [Trichonephila clavipes]|nr:hypothetical protein TNCV_1606661 [Trichonephila clavipes]
MDWYDDNGLNQLHWPAQSPDSNPTEKIWNELDHQIKECSNPPKSVKEFTCQAEGTLPQAELSSFQNTTVYHPNTYGKHALEEVIIWYKVIICNCLQWRFCQLLNMIKYCSSLLSLMSQSLIGR